MTMSLSFLIRMCSFIRSCRSHSSSLPFFVPTPLLLLSLLCLLRRWCGSNFFLLLEAAERVGVAHFTFPLPTSSLCVLLAHTLLLLQAADALLLG